MRRASGFTTVEWLVFAAVILVVVLALVGGADVSEWKQRCRDAGGVPLVDRGGERICLAARGFIMVIP